MIVPILQKYGYPYCGTAGTTDIDDRSFAFQIGGVITTCTAVDQILAFYLVGNEYHPSATLVHEPLIGDQGLIFWLTVPDRSMRYSVANPVASFSLTPEISIWLKSFTIRLFIPSVGSITIYMS